MTSSDTPDTETRTVAAGSSRYHQYLVGYLALTVVGTVALLVVVKHSSNLLAAVEVLVASGVLVVASATTIPALYGDATALAGTEWSPDWKRYVGFAVGAPAAVYLAIAYVTLSDIALVAASVAFVVAAFEATAVYLYHRRKHVESPT